MGKKEGTYLKTLRKIHERIQKKKGEVGEIEQEFLAEVKKEREMWVKVGRCTVCLAEGETEWHHIISQHRCREISKEYLIHSRTNVIEICRSCHDETTASLRRKHIEQNGGGAKTVKNPNGAMTIRQEEYIKKLGGENRITTNMTRGEASKLIDALKEESN
tara:strand:- start:737 stop:1219 length:483 start_codon:yes stop_codon:yes gene_type:complete